jgi:hypothetical protein
MLKKLKKALAPLQFICLFVKSVEPNNNKSVFKLIGKLMV